MRRTFTSLILIRTATIAVLFLAGSRASGQEVRISHADWTLVADPGACTLMVQHARLGCLLTNVQLNITQIPAHNHAIQVSSDTTSKTATPSPAVWLGESNPAKAYVTSGTANTSLAQNAIGVSGGGQPHINQQPFLVINFSIALGGIFPSRN